MTGPRRRRSHAIRIRAGRGLPPRRETVWFGRPPSRSVRRLWFPFLAPASRAYGRLAGLRCPPRERVSGLPAASRFGSLAWMPWPWGPHRRSGVPQPPPSACIKVPRVSCLWFAPVARTAVALPVLAPACPRRACCSAASRPLGAALGRLAALLARCSPCLSLAAWPPPVPTCGPGGLPASLLSLCPALLVLLACACALPGPSWSARASAAYALVTLARCNARRG